MDRKEEKRSMMEREGEKKREMERGWREKQWVGGGTECGY